MQEIVRRYFGPFEVTTPFGGRTATTGAVHRGVDIAAPFGTVFRSPVRGRVDRVYTEPEGGLVLDVNLPSGGDMLFAHLAQVGVRIGEEVTPGEVLGRTGASGRVTGPHLHYEVRSRVDDPSSAVDPLAFLQRATAAPRDGDCPVGSYRNVFGRCVPGRGGFVPEQTTGDLPTLPLLGEGFRLPDGTPNPKAPPQSDTPWEDIKGAPEALIRAATGVATGAAVGIIVMGVVVVIALMGVSRISSGD